MNKYWFIQLTISFLIIRRILVSPFSCCNNAYFHIVGLIKDHLILSKAVCLHYPQCNELIDSSHHRANKVICSIVRMLPPTRAPRCETPPRPGSRWWWPPACRRRRWTRYCSRSCSSPPPRRLAASGPRCTCSTRRRRWWRHGDGNTDRTTDTRETICSG